MWIVYIVKCFDGALYTGITTDVERRIKEHSAKIGAQYTNQAQKSEEMNFALAEAEKNIKNAVENSGNNRQDIFREESDYQKYLDILRHYKEKFLFKLYHYALMTNHIHLETSGRSAK